MHISQNLFNSRLGNLASLCLTIAVLLGIHLPFIFSISLLEESLVLSSIEALVFVLAIEIWYHKLSKLCPQ